MTQKNSCIYKNRNIICPGQCNPLKNNNNINENVNSRSSEKYQTEMRKDFCIFSRKNKNSVVNHQITKTKKEAMTDKIGKTLKKSARGRLVRTHTSPPATFSSTGIVQKISIILYSQFIKCCLTIGVFALVGILPTYIAWNQIWYKNFSLLQICGIATILFWRATGSAPF